MLAYLLTAIGAMSLIMLTLKFFSARHIYTPQAIMVNYLFAFTLALIKGHEGLTGGHLTSLLATDWWYLALLTGLLYFGSMNVMAISTRRAGVAVTAMASRTSVILPIIWAALLLGERISGWEVLGILLVLTAFVLIIGDTTPSDAPTPATATQRQRVAWWLPAGVFFSVGFIAICMKTGQHLIRNGGSYAEDYPVFETLLFAAAVLGSIGYYALTEGRKAFRPQWRSIVGGLCLGTFNYFVTFGTLHSLKYLSSSEFYGIYNISVVAISTVVGVLAFGERLTLRKVCGLVTALAAIFVLGFVGNSL